MEKTKWCAILLLYVAVSQIIQETVMSIYSLAHIQVGLNCLYSVAQMCTREDTLAHKLSVPYG